LFVFAVLATTLPAIAAPEELTLPADPPSHRTAALEEIWRLGGEEDDEVLLGVVTSGVTDEAGNVYLVDRQLSQVLVMSPDGELLETLGREGEGPGEMRQPHGLFVTPSGIGVVQGFPAKVVFINSDGTPGGEATLGGEASEGGFNFTRELFCEQDKLIGALGRGAFDMNAGTSTTTSYIAVMDMEGNTEASFAENVEESDFQKMVFDEEASWGEYESWCASPRGLIFSAADREEWAINVRDLQGNLVRTISRPFSPRVRSKQDKEDAAGDMVIVINGRRQVPENKALDTDAAIQNLNAADDGRLFVTTCFQTRTHLETGTAACYDVIGPDGAFIEELTLTFPGFDPEEDALVWIDGERFLMIRNYESAQAAMGAGRDGDEEEEEEDLGDAEPLEVVFVRIAG